MDNQNITRGQGYDRWVDGNYPGSLNWMVDELLLAQTLMKMCEHDPELRRQIDEYSRRET